MAWLGAVLAGGESRRFGSDKAAALLDGKTMVDRAAATLAEVFREVVVVSSRAPATRSWLHIPDGRPGQGPLAGIEAALRFADERGLGGAFVLACDLPLVDTGTIHAVLAALTGAAAAAPARQGDEGWEPLCAAYRLECLPWASAALDRGELAVHGLLDAVGAVRVAARPAALLNVNTPADHFRAVSVVDGAG